MLSHIIIWSIAILSTAGVIIRPYNLPEAIWVIAGSLLLLIMQLILPHEALLAINKGTDVYLFLTGMMLLAEIAREEKLFDWFAAIHQLHGPSAAVVEHLVWVDSHLRV